MCVHIWVRAYIPNLKTDYIIFACIVNKYNYNHKENNKFGLLYYYRVRIIRFVYTAVTHMLK